MAQIAHKASGSAPQEREVALEEHYVSGGEEELVFTKATPSTHIRNLMRKETTVAKERQWTDLQCHRRGRN